MNRSLIHQGQLFDEQQQQQHSIYQNQNINFDSGNNRHLSVTVQCGSNVGKVRWLQNSTTHQLIPDPFATEHFVSSTCSEQVSHFVKLFVNFKYICFCKVKSFL